MTNSNESERKPGDDLIQPRHLTANSIQADLEDYAIDNVNFSSLNHMKYGLTDNWTDEKGLSWEIDFRARHVFIDSKFTGDIFGISLVLSKGINYYSDDFIRAISEKEAYDLPKIEKLVELRLTHVSSFAMNQNADLGWAITDTYTTSEYTGSNKPGQEQKDKQYRTIVDSREIDMTKPKIDPTTENSLLDISKGIKSVYVEDFGNEINDMKKKAGYLKRMYDIFLVFQNGDESNLNLPEILPGSFLK